MSEDTEILAQDKGSWWNESLFLTEWHDVDAPRGRRVQTTWALFYERRLGQYPVVGTKNNLPGWSPATFEGDYRKLENVQHVSALVLDLEPPKEEATTEGATLEQIREVWAPVGHLLHSSYSHRLLGTKGVGDAPPLPRNCFRLILPLLRPVLGDEYRRLARWAYKVHEAAQIPTDTKASDPSRLWFVPAARPGEGGILVGTCWLERLLDPDAILALPEPPRVEPEVPQLTVGATDNPAYVQSAVERAVQAIFDAPEGARNNVLNREAYSLGGLVGAGALIESEVVGALLGATRAAGWAKSIKNEACIRRAVEDGKAKPRAVKAPLSAAHRPEARVSYLEHQAPAEPAPKGAEPIFADPSDQQIRQAIVTCLQGTKSTDQTELLFRVKLSFPALVRPPEEAILRQLDTLIEEGIVDLSPEGDYWLLESPEIDPNEVADQAPLQGTPGGAEPPANPPAPPPSGGGEIPPPRPMVTLGGNRVVVLDATLDAMGQTRAFFQRGGKLVEPIREWVSTRDGQRRYARGAVTTIHSARLEELLLRNIDFQKWDNLAREYKPANPPIWLMQQIFNRGTWDTALPLRGVTEAPVLRPDGTLLCEEGYDEATGLIYRPNATYLPVDLYPTLEAVQQAKERLLSLVKDFPFESAAHRAVWLAALLTPICRPAFEGPAPLFLFDANVRAAGKTKLVHLIGRILQGENVDAMAYTSDDIEMEKKILSIAKNGQPITFFDDIGGSFGTPSLNNALTSTRFQGRTLGVSEMASYDLKTIWYASGNNVQVFRDMARRIAHIRLRSADQNPEHRELPDVLREATLNRPLYLHAAHTLILGWVAAGRPRQKIKGWGSFEGWSEMLRQIVLWVGEPDPGETRDEMAQNSDTEGNALASLIEGWALLQAKKMRPEGLTAKMVLEHLDNNRSDEELDGLREAIDVLCPGSKDRSRQLGNRLSHLRDRVVEGRCLSHGDDKRNKAGVLWTVRQVKEGAAQEPPAPAP